MAESQEVFSHTLHDEGILNLSQYHLLSFPGKIRLINSDQELQNITDELYEVKEFGFDTETRPAFKKGEVYRVALLQLSTETDAYLFRLQRMNRYDVLKKIFENPQILKVGAAIRDDLKQLQKIVPFVAQNFVELQELAKKKGLKNFGLKGMTEEILGATISKGPKTTNWEAHTLTDRQLLYAATDAWVGLKLYKEMLTSESNLSGAKE